MGNLVKTFRITKFKGLNKSINPHNLHDAEFSELINAELTKNGTVQSRRGYSVVGSLTSGSNKWVGSIYKTTIGGTPTLYYHGGLGLYKMDESDGSTTTIASPIVSNQRAQFLRYHDRVLFLSEDQRLKWFDSGESLNIVAYPFLHLSEFRTPEPSRMTTAAGGDLDQDKYYQYAVSIVCGDDLRDGESALSRGVSGGPMGPYRYPIHAHAQTTDTNKTIGTTGVHLQYNGQTYGFAVRKLRLFRRQGYPGIDWVGDPLATTWVLLDEAELSEDSSGNYTLELTTSRQGDKGDEVIITSLTGSVDANNVIELVLAFIDKGDSGVNVAQQPRDAISSITPSSKFMTRLYNRILIANITGTGDSADAKKVYYSYRGWNERLDDMEIPDFWYKWPMLIFPQNNFFYCDKEDVEDEITAITSYKNSILIFTERCTFLWEEGMADPMKLSNDVGCMSMPSIQEFEGKLIWLGRNGFYQYDGDKLKNLTWEKMQPYMDNVTWSATHRATSTIYDRRYFISLALYGLTENNYVLVYDFDLKTWHVRQYLYHDGGMFKITSLFTYRDGSGETLYAGGTQVHAVKAQLVKLEQGGKDSNQDITVTIKTKYYDFGAPDIQKTVRNFYLDIENYASAFSGDLYLDGLAGAAYSFSMTPTVGSRVMLLNNAGRTLNYSYVGVISDESLALSMERGLIGSRFMFGFSLTAAENTTRIHSLGVDWLPKRKLKRIYGGT